MQADKGHFPQNYDACLSDLRICVDAPVCSIKIYFSYQGAFLRTFDTYGCVRLEYPDDSEAVETRLEFIPQYPFIYG